MIYCQVSTRIAHEGAGKWRGDILVAKAFPLYSPKEHQVALIVEIEDELLESLFSDQVTMMVHPYAEYDENEANKMILRSRKYIDIESMSNSLKTAILDPTETVEMLLWQDVEPYFLVRTEERF